MRTFLLKTTLRQISRRTSYRTINNARTAKRYQSVDWKRTLCLQLSRPLDFVVTEPEDNLPQTFVCFEDEDGT